MPRHPRYLNEQELQLVEELSAFSTLENIAHNLGMSLRCFHEIKVRQAELDASYKKGKAKGIKLVASKLFATAMAGNVAAQIFYLKTQAGWTTSEKIDLTNSDGKLSGNTKISVRFIKHPKDVDESKVEHNILDE